MSFVWERFMYQESSHIYCTLTLSELQSTITTILKLALIIDPDENAKGNLHVRFSKNTVNLKMLHKTCTTSNRSRQARICIITKKHLLQTTRERLMHNSLQIRLLNRDQIRFQYNDCSRMTSRPYPTTREISSILHVFMNTCGSTEYCCCCGNWCKLLRKNSMVKMNFSDNFEDFGVYTACLNFRQ